MSKQTEDRVVYITIREGGVSTTIPVSPDLFSDPLTLGTYLVRMYESGAFAFLEEELRECGAKLEHVTITDVGSKHDNAYLWAGGCWNTPVEVRTKFAPIGEWVL